MLTAKTSSAQPAAAVHNVSPPAVCADCVLLQLPNSSNSSYSMRQIYQKFLLPYEDYEQDRLRREALGSMPPEQAPPADAATAVAAGEPAAAAEPAAETPAAAAPPPEKPQEQSGSKRARKESAAARRSGSKKAAASSKRDRSLEAEEDYEELDEDEEDKASKKKKKKVSNSGILLPLLFSESWKLRSIADPTLTRSKLPCRHSA